MHVEVAARLYSVATYITGICPFFTICSMQCRVYAAT